MRGDINFDSLDLAGQCSPVEAEIRNSRRVANVEPFSVFLKGTTNNNESANGWQRMELPGPCLLRANIVGAGDILTNSNYAMQYVGFLYAPGPREPQSLNSAFHSRGIGEGYASHGGTWWIRPIRPDIQTSITVFPMICPEASTFALGAEGAANLHSHYGIALAPIANDGGDPTIPASTTYFLLYSYHIRKTLQLIVPKRIYTKNGGTNWFDASDLTVNQETNNVLIGYTQYLLGSNLARYHMWDSSPPSNIGRGLKTLCAGDSVTWEGDSRWPGVLMFFNLSPVTAYTIIEEVT